jgi:integrase
VGLEPTTYGLTVIEEREPKTKHGKRAVPLSPTAEDLSRGLQARQTVVGLDGYVFAINGEPVHPQDIIDCFQRLQTEFRSTRPEIRRLTFYGVRHTAITCWIKAGIDTATVSKMVGHASYAFTVDHYKEVLNSDLTDAAAKMG